MRGSRYPRKYYAQYIPTKGKKCIIPPNLKKYLDFIFKKAGVSVIAMVDRITLNDVPLPPGTSAKLSKGDKIGLPGSDHLIVGEPGFFTIDP